MPRFRHHNNATPPKSSGLYQASEQTHNTTPITTNNLVKFNPMFLWSGLLFISHRLHQFRATLTPKHIINLCFITVFIFTTILFWWQGSLLYQGYKTSQLSQLKSVAAQLQSRMQYRINNLHFLRNYIASSLQAPLSARQQKAIIDEIARVRNLGTWQITPSDVKGLPIFGVNPRRLQGAPLFKAADDQQLIHEINATLKLRSLLSLTDVTSPNQPRISYISRSGFYLSAPSPKGDYQIEALYHRMIVQHNFTRTTKSVDPLHIPYWTPVYNDLSDEPVITASLPINYKNRWIGTLSMDFTVEKLRQFLINSVPLGNKNVYLLFNNSPLTVTSSVSNRTQESNLTPQQWQKIKGSINTARLGTIRLNSHFVTFNVIDNTNAVLVHIQNLPQVLQSEYGRLSLLLTTLWIMFAILLLVTRRIILRLIDNMEGLQKKLSWRASHDAMTHMLNRASFFQLSEEMAEKEQQHQRPLSLIQMDLDRFKHINDNFGHQVGDQVLIHAAKIILHSVRTQDLVGRVGGEEFCILLPGSNQQQAAEVAERIRNNLLTSPLQTEDGNNLPITASLGVVCSEELNSYELKHLQLIADRRLYRAKANGRNQIYNEGELSDAI